MGSKNALCLVSVMLLAHGVLGHAQSLTEIAKKEKDRQAKARAAGAPAKVYTEDGAAGSSDAKGSLTVMGATGATEPKAAAQTGAPTSSPIPARPREALVRDRRSFREVSVTLYVTSWCPYCRKARALLGSLPNLRVVTHDIEKDKAKGAEMLAKTGGETGIPVIDIEGTVLQGFSAAAITDAIERARAK